MPTYQIAIASWYFLFSLGIASRELSDSVKSWKRKRNEVTIPVVAYLLLFIFFMVFWPFFIGIALTRYVNEYMGD